MAKPEEVLKEYNIEGAIKSIALFGGGHINDTFLVETSGQDVLLQKINRRVFRHLSIMESNLNALMDSNSEILVTHLKDQKGNYISQVNNEGWKAQLFDSNLFTPSLADDKQVVREVAKGFGQFMALNQVIDSNSFSETIPRFHDLDLRLKQFELSISENRADRLVEVTDLVDQAKEFRWISERFNMLREELPKRVCHNDTKIDNVLLSKAGNEFRKVIDLDTVGPGYALFDFGDILRTMLSPTAEDEREIDKIELREDYLDLIMDNYVNECKGVLTKTEIENLAFGGLYMTYMIGLRFLTDYLNGDVYYKVQHEDDNFIRARNQFRLLELLVNHVK